MTDNVRDRSASESELICRALAALFVVEVAPVAAEAALHALAEFDGFDMTPRDALTLVVDENRWQTPWAAHYVERCQESPAERRRQ